MASTYYSFLQSQLTRSLLTQSLLISMIASGAAFAQQTSLTQEASSNIGDQGVIFVGPDNPDVKITIKANPSTGYQWLLHNYNADLLTPVKSSYHEDPKLPKAQNLGASVNQVWEFKIDDQAFAVPTITQISFVHLRPWDANNSLSSKDKDDLIVKIIIDPTYKAKSNSGTTEPKQTN